MEKIYITTTLPYVNADPHIGHALEFVQADAFARYHRSVGNDVFFNTGTDEHGQKIFEKAQEEGIDTQSYVDQYAKRFKTFCSSLGISYDRFIRTTDEDHKKAAQAFWMKCFENSDIEKKLYKVKYCVGCELEKTDSELEDGKCPLHPNKELELREEENYFFKFSNYQESLLKLYEERSNFVIPDYRFREIKSFVVRGLEDFSISRVKEKMSWGVPVPNDPDHVMYVWFDALVNYVSAIGWPDKSYKDWWPVVQFAGKDNLRQQSAMWQAMLLSAGIEPSKQIVIHGFINSNGKKMSKSLGNVVDPVGLINEYGADAVRYYLLRHVHPFEDSDYTDEKFKEAYTANLVNGIGNLTSRVLKMSEQYLDASVDISDIRSMPEVGKSIENYEFHKAADLLWHHVGELDALIQEQKPFEVVKTNKVQAQKQLTYLTKELARIAIHLEPLLPDTSAKILNAIKENKKPDESLFPRK